MAKMKDLWEVSIDVSTTGRFVNVSCEENHSYYEDVRITLRLDADLTRQLIEELKKALDEAEDA